MATITEPSVVKKILSHLNLPTEPLPRARAQHARKAQSSAQLCLHAHELPPKKEQWHSGWNPELQRSFWTSQPAPRKLLHVQVPA
jgi:hypothetical protein